MIILPFSFTANSALSATTTKTIQGTAPYLSSKLTTEIQSSSFSLLGFTFGGKDYDDTTLSSLYIDPHKYSPATLKAAITGKVIKSQLSASEASDDDGDNSFTLLAKSSLSVSILNSSGTDISGDASLFSDSFCSNLAPYKVKIKISGDLSLTTQYGDPPNKDYTSTTPETNKQPSKAYEVPIAGICNLKPASMQVFNIGDLSLPNGYNSTKWEINKGFKVTSGFPTTGFDKAVFSIIGSGNDQKDYKCERESGGNWVTYSADAASTSLGEGCKITYNSPTGKPSSPIIIKMSYKGTKIDSFTIPVPTKWAIGKGHLAYSDTGNLSTANSFPVLDACRLVGSNASEGITTKQEATGQNIDDKAFRQQYLYRRNELTNSPQVNIEEGSSPSSYDVNYFSRDVGTFMGEWGVVTTYSNSGWVSGIDYWTAEALSPSAQFFVNLNGRVHHYSPDNNYAAICRGE